MVEKSNNNKKFDKWFGVPRKEIPWYPIIDPGQCIGCGFCAAICGRGVYKYDFDTKKPIVANPYHCLVGCQTCANLCPVGAIEFPEPESLKKYIAKYKVFAKVKEVLTQKYISTELSEYKKQMNHTEVTENEIIDRVLRQKVK